MTFVPHCMREWHQNIKKTRHYSLSTTLPRQPHTARTALQCCRGNISKGGRGCGAVIAERAALASAQPLRAQSSTLSKLFRRRRSSGAEPPQRCTCVHAATQHARQSACRQQRARRSVWTRIQCPHPRFQSRFLQLDGHSVPVEPLPFSEVQFCVYWAWCPVPFRL